LEFIELIFWDFAKIQEFSGTLAHQLKQKDQMYRLDQPTLGNFVEKECKMEFTYRLTTDEWALSKGYTHEIDVLDGTRFARVKLTVAYVLCDGDSYYDDPEEQKWLLTKNVRLNKD